jgi:hypothetical protein
VVSEASDATDDYGVSVEQISPAPPDGISLVLAQNITGDVNPPTAQDAFTFKGTTSGTYEVAASLAPSPSSNVCFKVYQPDGTAVVTGACTALQYPYYNYSVSADVTPAENGTYVVVVYTEGNDATVSYNLEVSCLLGKCVQEKPTCLLIDEPTYDSSSDTLTMKFYVETPEAATWNGWLNSQSTNQLLFSQSQPIAKSPTEVIVTQGNVSPSGVVGVLSTLTTSSGGIECSSWQTVNTGNP